MAKTPIQETLTMKLLSGLEDLSEAVKNQFPVEVEGQKPGEAEKNFLGIHDRLMLLSDPVSQLEEHCAKRDLELKLLRSFAIQVEALAKNGIQPQTPVDHMRNAKDLYDIVQRYKDMAETLERV